MEAKTAAKMRFEQQLKLADIDAALAAHGRKVLSGEAGQRLLSSFVRARDSLAPVEQNMGR